MRLSKATANDFEFCESLYGKQSTDMIYRWEGNEDDAECAQNFSCEYLITDEMWARMDEEIKFTREKFLSNILNNYIKILIIYDEKNEKIGYFQLSLIGTGRWKLQFMFLKEEEHEFKIFKEAIDLLNEKIKRIEVCIIDDEVKKYFLKAGFRENCSFYFFKTNKRLE